MKPPAANVKQVGQGNTVTPKKETLMRNKRFGEAMQETCASTGDVFWLLDLISIHALSFQGSAWQTRGVSS